MAMDLMESHAVGAAEAKDTLYMLGGVALMVFGAGLVLSNPTIRRYISQFSGGNLASSVMPDVEGYFRLRAM